MKIALFEKDMFLPKPIVTSLGTVYAWKNYFLKIEDTWKNITAYGEAAPLQFLLKYSNTNENVLTDIMKIIRELDWLNIDLQYIERFHLKYANISSETRAMFDMSFHDYIAKKEKKQVWELYVADKNKNTFLTETIWSDNIEEIVNFIKEKKSLIDFFKIKATAINVDNLPLSFLADYNVIIDFNWLYESSKDFLNFLDRVPNKNSFIFEEPFYIENLDLNDVNSIRKKIQEKSCKLIFDDSFFSEESLNKIININIADWLNLKIQKLWWIYPSYEFYKLFPLDQYIIGCVLESSLWIASSIQLGNIINSISENPLILDLDSDIFLWLESNSPSCNIKWREVKEEYGLWYTPNLKDSTLLYEVNIW